jgi:hypothetical protein
MMCFMPAASTSDQRTRSHLNCPRMLTAAQSKDWQHDTIGHSGAYVMARPFGCFGVRLPYSVKLAWIVFTGNADVVFWQE